MYKYSIAMINHQLVVSFMYTSYDFAHGSSLLLIHSPSLQKKEEAKVAKERSEKKWQKDHAYDDLFSEENMESSSNQNRPDNWEDDFM